MQRLMTLKAVVVYSSTPHLALKGEDETLEASGIQENLHSTRTVVMQSDACLSFIADFLSGQSIAAKLHATCSPPSSPACSSASLKSSSGSNTSCLIGFCASGAPSWSASA